MDEVLIKAVQKIANARAGCDYDYETVAHICEALLSLSTLIVKREVEHELQEDIPRTEG